MPVKIQKWGNSAAVRIPAAMLEASDLKLNAPAEIREQDGGIVIMPVTKPSYELDILLADITPENQHTEIDTGQSVGLESF